MRHKSIFWLIVLGGVIELLLTLTGCALLPIPPNDARIPRLIYVADSEPETVAQVKAAGFQGYIAYGVEIAVMFDPPRDVFFYFDEPEDRPDVYRAWKTLHATERRLVAYGNFDRAKDLGVWETDHALLAHHEYPYTNEGWFLIRWWEQTIAYPFHLWQWKRAVEDSKTPVVGTIQAFGAPTRPEQWVFPGCDKIKSQEAQWHRAMGDQLVAIAYFIWATNGPENFEGLRDHPECWPANRP
jgi:hypothetical protein